MLFHSQEFLLAFLPVVLALYYWAAGVPAVRRWLLIAASVFFYGWWDPRLVPLLLGSVMVNWAFARLYGPGRRGLVPLGVTLNLLVLGVFKYADFFADTVTALTGTGHDPWNIVLPLGISFFTFQQISYLIDLRRGTAPRYAFADYALYVSFFPQLIAGPIVRHDEIVNQYALDPRRAGLDERLSRGFVLLVIGLAKKILIADRLAQIADPLYAAAGEATAMTLAEGWMAAAAFGLQIYFDFSAYSDMAIGLGLMFGLALPINFDAPYRAGSIREFWRRWHMTLSRFLRDYLYIPLGGNRHGAARQMAALMVTMLLGGLWHGAGWTFVAWGGLHGAALAVNHAWTRLGGRMPWAAGWALTMLFVFVVWVFFRAESFAAAAHILTAMSGAEGLSLAVAKADELWIVAGAALVALFGVTSHRFALDRMTPIRWGAVAVGLAFAYLALEAGRGQYQEFIYFQF